VAVDGQPLVILFNPADAPPAGLSNLQATVRAAGLPGLAVAGCGSGAASAGFALRTHYNIVPGYSSGAAEHPFAELVETHRKAWMGTAEQPYLPTVTAGWDKRPWEGPRGLNQKEGWYFTGRTPEAFGGFVRSAIDWMDAHPDQTTKERLLLIYAWNEFGEGGYLAPTRGDSEGRYLQALRAAVFSPHGPPGSPSAGTP
jgi:hypothetical protein